MISPARLLRNGRSTAGRLFSAILLVLLPFAALSQFTYITNNDALTITRYTGLGGDVTIPATINGLPVTSIGNAAFFESISLTSLTIPNSVTNIGAAAFQYCSSLIAITIPDSVRSIGYVAFFFCTSLSEITVDALNSNTSVW
jgi:hypothetical protein